MWAHERANEDIQPFIRSGHHTRSSGWDGGGDDVAAVQEYSDDTVHHHHPHSLSPLHSTHPLLRWLFADSAAFTLSFLLSVLTTSIAFLPPSTHVAVGVGGHLVAWSTD